MLLTLDDWQGRRNWHRLNRLVIALDSEQPSRADSHWRVSEDSPDVALASQPTPTRVPASRESDLSASDSPTELPRRLTVWLATIALIFGAAIAIWGLSLGQTSLAVRFGLPLAIIGQAVLVGGLLFRPHIE